MGRVPSVTVEPLGPQHAEELGRVHVAVWREAYAGLMPADHLASLDAVASAERWRTSAADPDPAVRTWVARDDEGLLGFVAAGSSRDDDPPTPLELWAVNLLPRARGTGLADRLLATAIGDEPASLWVLVGNARAIAFYARHGFADDGTRKPHHATGVTELRMVRPGRDGA